MSDPLEVLLADGVIDEVLGRLKSGKEANISLVRRGDGVLAAKVYKDRATRSFKNNADYKEGRKVRNTRTQRAMDSGGRFGRDAAEQAWKSAEADAMYRLVGSGVRIPRPVMFYEGVLLMELVTDGHGRPAPRMIDVAIEPAAAIGVYADLVAQIIAMLCCDLIHGDLSPYNILAAADGPTIIDFPQVVSAVHSSRAEFFFLRDFDNVVRFLADFDPALAVHRHDGRAIWRAYVSRELTPQFVPPPPPPPQASRPRFDPRREQRPDSRRTDPRRGDRRQGQPPEPPRSHGPRRDDPPLQHDPHRSTGSPRIASPHGSPPQGPDASRHARSDPRRPPERSTGAPQGRPPQNRPPQDRARPTNERAAAPQRPAPPSRDSAASPASNRGRRRRPKRHW
ncbi:MAG TPA: RIO1 family regulatory kinase/ATPase [Kofleriaceae bacterium]|jgi:RIO kinase 1